MGIFNLNFLFDEGVTDRVIITYDAAGRKYNAAVRLTGSAKGYGVYSSGQTPQAAVDRALESAEKPERWRKLAF